jgi:hypothetical protein
MRVVGPIGSLLLAAILVGCGLPSPTLSPSPPVPTPSPPPSAVTPSPFPSAPSPSPQPSPVSEGSFPTACLNLDPRDCGRVRDLVLATLPTGGPTISFVEVGPFACPVDPCPETVDARPTGRIMVEYADGSEPTTLDVSVQAGELTTRPAEEVLLVDVLPSSQRLDGTEASIELGHCGLLSGIDVDGSYWDPVGYVDMQHPDAINAAEATFTMTTPATARLETAGGLGLDLIRRSGSKRLPLCQ